MKGAGAKPDPNGGATVDVMVKNTGKRAGNEIVQVYLGFPKAAGEPPKQLKGLAKVALKPGEEQRVQVKLDPDAFQYWNDAKNGWTTAPGAYQVMVGNSSRDIEYTTNVTPANR